MPPIQPTLNVLATDARLGVGFIPSFRLSALHDATRARREAAASAFLASGAAPPGAEAAVAVLQSRLEAKEEELRRLASASPGACAGCASAAAAPRCAFEPPPALRWRPPPAPYVPLFPLLACCFPFFLLWRSLLGQPTSLALTLASACVAAWPFEGGGASPRPLRAALLLVIPAVTAVALLLFMLRTRARAACLAAYVIWSVFFDGAPSRAGRAFPALSTSPFWADLAASHRITLRPLHPKPVGFGPHIVVLSPTSHLSAAALLAFAGPTHPCFPRTRVLWALRSGWAIHAPLLREALLALGCVSTTATSSTDCGAHAPLVAALRAAASTDCGADGGAVVLVAPCGAAGEAGAGARRAAARAALETGAALVPAYAAGATDDDGDGAATRFLGFESPLPPNLRELVLRTASASRLLSALLPFQLTAGIRAACDEASRRASSARRPAVEVLLGAPLRAARCPDAARPSPQAVDALAAELSAAVAELAAQADRGRGERTHVALFRGE